MCCGVVVDVVDGLFGCFVGVGCCSICFCGL